MEKFIKISVAKGCRGHKFPIVETLFSVVDDTQGIEFHDIPGEILGMEAEVILLQQGLDGCLGRRVQANLDGGAIVYKT